MTTTPFADLQPFVHHPDFHYVPLKRTLYADHTTPLRLLAALREHHPRCFLLESVADPQHRGRYTFLGYKPRLTVSTRRGTTTITYSDGRPATTTTVPPRDVIEELLGRYHSPRLSDFPPFTGGLVGYLSYDYFAVSEPALELTSTDDEQFSDVDLMLFDNVICFDHFAQQMILLTNIPTDDLEDSYHRGVSVLDEMEDLAYQQPTHLPEPLSLGASLTPDRTAAEFGSMVERAQHYIHEGDIFQVVLSNRLQAPAEGSLYDAYRVLRTTNPSPYMFYFTSPDVELIGASPETLVSVTSGVACTFPLAGTRPRGATPAEDAELEKGLLHDPKELAEHHMLVDLGRNDLGRCAAPGSVRVTELAHVHRYSHVMHIGSVVQADLAEGKTALDMLGSVLPAGTLSGAPKIRAGQIIDELEGVRRGIYGGAIGYLDFTGNMDMCIAIRFAYKRAGKVAVRSGAGIVADSQPAREYQETINKARAVVEALERADGGLARETGV